MEEVDPRDVSRGLIQELIDLVELWKHAMPASESDRATELIDKINATKGE